jgi:hypothetical protein
MIAPMFSISAVTRVIIWRLAAGFIGGNLAMFEITAILTAIAKQVESITVHWFRRVENAVLHGFAELGMELA